MCTPNIFIIFFLPLNKLLPTFLKQQVCNSYNYCLCIYLGVALFQQMDLKFPFFFILLLLLHHFLGASSPNPFLSCFVCKLNVLSISADAAVSVSHPVRILCCFFFICPTAWFAEARACPAFCLIIFASCLEAFAMAR